MSTQNVPMLPAEKEFQMLQYISKTAAMSGLYNTTGGEQKIFMILLAAQELGIKPMQALNGGIWNINGRIEISARLMNAMIRKAGYSIVIKEADATKCILEGKRHDSGDCFTSQFTIEDAARAGLAGRDNWKKYAEDMLYSRAMSRLARRLFPDIIGEAYVEGEIRDAKNDNSNQQLQEADCQITDSLPIAEQEKCKKFELSSDEMIVTGQFFCKFEESLVLMKQFMEAYCIHHCKTALQFLEVYREKDNKE